MRLVVQAAFNQPGEADLVDMLRADGVAAITLVAEKDGQLVGHILLSVLESPREWLAIAPLSVHPDWQGQGIGDALVSAALKQASAEGWKGVFALAVPGYYERFGFSVETADIFHSDYPAEYLQAIELMPGVLPEHPVDLIFAPAFSALS